MKKKLIKMKQKPKKDWELKKGKYDYPPKYMVEPQFFDKDLHEDIKIKR